MVCFALQTAMNIFGGLRMRRLIPGLILCGFLASSLGAEAAQKPVDWYRWYKQLHGYLGSVGGVLCEPGTALQFHTDGKITSDSEDNVCTVSLQRLSYPLPVHAPVEQISLVVRKRSQWPLSRKTLQDLLETQLNRTTAQLPRVQ